MLHSVFGVALNDHSLIDFLLRVNAEESRALGILGFRGTRTGVSRLESVSPVEVDDAWLSQTAVTTILRTEWRSHG